MTLCLAMMPLASMAQQGLKDAIGKYCLIGAAINQWQSDGQVPEADALTDKRCTIPAEAKTVIANNYVRAMMAANSLR